MFSSSMEERGQLLGRLAHQRNRQYIKRNSRSRWKRWAECSPRTKLEDLCVLLQGHAILRSGGEAMDAVVAAVTVMEGEC